MHLIGRRNFLASLGLGAGSYLLSPMFRQLVSEAQAAPGAPRLLLYLTGGGFPKPLKEEPGYWPTNEGGKVVLSKSVEPLSPHASEVSFWESFYVPYNLDLHGNGFSTSTMRPVEGKGEEQQPTGISFDRWIANSISADAPIRSLLLGTNEEDSGDVQYTDTADGPRAIVQPLLNPITAYETVFAGAQSGGAGRDAEAAARLRLKQRRSVLDGIASDIKKMQGRLAGPEREKLDQYLSSVTDLETTLEKLVDAQSSCETPAAPSPTVYNKGRKSPKLPVYTAMKDIAINALACGMTRVVTFFAAEGDLDFMPSEVSPNPCGGHGMWHAGTPRDHVTYYNFQFGNMAEMWSRLGKFSEGDRSVASNTLLLNLCVNGGSHHGGHDRYFALLLGDLGGKLQKGKYLQFPEKQRSLADVYHTLGLAFGLKSDGFGAAELKSKPLDGVLT